MTATTVIRDIDWLVAWDGTGHVYLRGADLAFADGAVTFVGKGYAGGLAIYTEGVNGHRAFTRPAMRHINIRPVAFGVSRR